MKDFRVTLISTEETPLNIGARSISSYLKSHGYKTRVLFLTTKKRYTRKVLDRVLQFSEDSGLIGISCTSWTAGKAVDIINYLKPLGIPIVWGGIHATTNPELCLRHADIVCRTDGERTILKLAKNIEMGDDITGIENLWVRRDGKIYRNKIKPVQDIDSLPFPDYDPDNQHVLEKARIVGVKERHYNVTTSLHKKYLTQLVYPVPVHTYYGCPYSCSYCMNSVVKKIIRSPIRKKSIDYVIKEIKHMREKLPFVTAVYFTDDNFFLRTTEEIEEFSRRYSDSIGLPFTALTHPLWLSERKLKPLVDAGLRVIEVGIQSGSERLNREIYNRHVSERRIKDACALINKYKDTLLPDYHIIIRNPYETKEDILKSINLLRAIPKPYYLSILNLLFFRGTPICEMAERDGIINLGNEPYKNAGKLRFGKAETYLYNILTMMSGFCDNEYYGIIPSCLMEMLIDSREMKPEQADMIRNISGRIRIYPKEDWQVIEFDKGRYDKEDVIESARGFLKGMHVLVEEGNDKMSILFRSKLPGNSVTKEILDIIHILERHAQIRQTSQKISNHQRH